MSNTTVEFGPEKSQQRHWSPFAHTLGTLSKSDNKFTVTEGWLARNDIRTVVLRDLVFVALHIQRLSTTFLSSELAESGFSIGLGSDHESFCTCFQVLRLSSPSFECGSLQCTTLDYTSHTQCGPRRMTLCKPVSPADQQKPECMQSFISRLCLVAEHHIWRGGFVWLEKQLMCMPRILFTRMMYSLNISHNEILLIAARPNELAQLCREGLSVLQRAILVGLTVGIKLGQAKPGKGSFILTITSDMLLVTVWVES